MVDEGHDFALGWLESLFYLLVDPESDVFYVFHDPAQALYRPDVVASLKLPEYQLDMNCRNPRSIHELAARYHGAGDMGTGTIDPAYDSSWEWFLPVTIGGNESLTQLAVC